MHSARRKIVGTFRFHRTPIFLAQLAILDVHDVIVHCDVNAVLIINWF